MTKEEKQLLLKDLCARLPYGVKGLHRGQVHELFTIDSRDVNNACIQVDGYDAWFSVNTFKPYLRPMSSMTEEERKEFDEYTFEIVSFFGQAIEAERLTDWLNAHMLDILGLIPKGLAIEAPEDMYKTE